MNREREPLLDRIVTALLTFFAFLPLLGIVAFGAVMLTKANELEKRSLEMRQEREKAKGKGDRVPTKRAA